MFLSLAVDSAVSCWVLVTVLAKEAIVLFIVVSRPSTGLVFSSYDSFANSVTTNNLLNDNDFCCFLFVFVCFLDRHSAWIL